MYQCGRTASCQSPITDSLRSGQHLLRVMLLIGIDILRHDCHHFQLTALGMLMAIDILRHGCHHFQLTVLGLLCMYVYICHHFQLTALGLLCTYVYICHHFQLIALGLSCMHVYICHHFQLTVFGLLCMYVYICHHFHLTVFGVRLIWESEDVRRRRKESASLPHGGPSKLFSLLRWIFYFPA